MNGGERRKDYGRKIRTTGEGEKRSREEAGQQGFRKGCGKRGIWVEAREKGRKKNIG